MRVGIYVDGFNVYYGGLNHCGRGQAGWRWLDLVSLSTSLIDPAIWQGAQAKRLVYCTAHRKTGDPADQRAYIAAVEASAVPVTVVYGQYAARVKKGDLVDANERRVPSPGSAALPAWLPVREVTGPSGGKVLRAAVTTFEEKGSDVNVATHLLLDVLTGQVDAAIVYSNDSDLAEPIRLAKRRIPVGLVNPGTSPTPASLKGEPDAGAGNHWWRRLSSSDFRAHQFPAQVGGVQRPPGW